jgi:peptide/nickel transport system permease protein
VFAWPGLGKLAVDSIFQRDFPVIQAILTLSAAVFIVINLLVDLTYTVLDPRIRYS